jgi:hypothetical protein
MLLRFPIVTVSCDMIVDTVSVWRRGKLDDLPLLFWSLYPPTFTDNCKNTFH